MQSDGLALRSTPNGPGWSTDLGAPLELSSLLGSLLGVIFRVLHKERDPLRICRPSGLERGLSGTRAEESHSCSEATDRLAQSRGLSALP
jgi:hypothetical protein